MYRLVKIYEKNKKVYKPSRNVLAIFIPVLDHHLANNDRIDIIEVTLKCILSLVETNKEAIFSSIAAEKYTLKCVLEYLCLDQQPYIRYLCSSILTNFLCSQKYAHIEEVGRLGLLDQIHKCSKM